MAAFAEHEARRISERSRDALPKADDRSLWELPFAASVQNVEAVTRLNGSQALSWSQSFAVLTSQTNYRV